MKEPFSSDGLWKLSNFTLQSLQPLETLKLDDKLPGEFGHWVNRGRADTCWRQDFTVELFKNPLEPLEKNYSAVYQLDIFGTNSFEPSETTSDASSEKQNEYDATHGQHDDDDASPGDIWSIGMPERGNPEPPLRSWERYLDTTFHEPVSAYFTDSGAKGWDAALAHQARINGNGSPGRIARNVIFFRALIELGLGWNSVFYKYNYKKRRFDKNPLDVRISGVSLYALDKATDIIQQCGTDMLRARTFVSGVSAKSSPAMSAFSGAVAVVVHTLEKKLVSRGFAEIGHDISLLRIRALFERCGVLVSVLADMVDAVERAAASDAQIVSAILDRIAHFSHRYDWMHSILSELAVRTLQPWLDLVETWIGLRSEDPSFVELLKHGMGFVKLDQVEVPWKANPIPVRAEYRYIPEQMPYLIPPEQAQSVYEVGKSLRLLKQSHPQHPIANECVLYDTRPPKLSCAISWQDIERMQHRAYDYESRIRAEVLKYNRRDTHGESICLPTPNQAAGVDPVDTTYAMFNIDDKLHCSSLPVNNPLEEDCKLEQSCVDAFEHYDSFECSFGPELPSALSLSLSPVIASQALLIDFSCLHLLFKEHDLRYHLNLQWRFQLLGDGFFTSRLSSALFDPAMESGERRRGKARGSFHTGLRLGSRDTWPPASSELRLVLTSLLSECFPSKVDGSEADESAGRHDYEFPGGLSFAIRELSDEELVKCKDANAIEALDFLRLQYKPSAVLETILTPQSLHQYDVLLRHLLRLLRMVSVVGMLVRDSTSRGSLSGHPRNLFQRFRLEAQHFILALADYCFSVGVGSSWKRFEDALSRIEHCLDQGDIDGTIDAAHSVPMLRRYHEAVLDQMLFALFLNKRHAQVAKLLEGICSTILSFAVFSRLDGESGIRQENEELVSRLYASFRKRVGSLVHYLRQLNGADLSSSKKVTGLATSSPAEPTSFFDHLLLRLDMRPYY